VPATTMSRSTRTNVQLANLDLNLLVSLDVLLQERSVTRAAARLGLSQPTLSTTLARLRRHFGDELLTRVGNRYELTPLAADLLPRTADAVSVVQKIFARQPEFEPAESDREFAVLASDYVITVFGQALAVALRERTPGIGLRLELIKGGFSALPRRPCVPWTGWSSRTATSPACPTSTCSRTDGCAWCRPTTTTSATASPSTNSRPCPRC